MKKMLLLSLILIGIVFAGHAQIQYRKAEESDIVKLLGMYQFIQEKDIQAKSNLLLFPVEVRALKVTKDVSDGRIFVALDERKRLIGFIKMFIVCDDNEKIDILHNELCCKSSTEGGVLLLNGSYHIPLKELTNFKYHLELDSENALESEKLNALCSVQENATYLYFGGAYTHPTYRKGGVSSNLIKYAFSQLKNDIVAAGSLVMLYGQVMANVDQKHMVRVFAQFVMEYYCDEATEIALYHCAYRAYKPELFFSEETLSACRNFKTMQISFPEENKGQGNILLFTRTT